MGNSLGGRKTAKVMKLDGETIKFKVPVRVEEVVKDHPEHVLMDSEAVRHLGVRAKPMEGYRELKPRRLYFLVQLPKPAALLDHKAPRRVRSGVINMSAKDRLESLMLSRRSVSDLSLVTASTAAAADGAPPGPLRVKMRLPRAQVAKLVEESKDAGEAAERIMELCAAKGEEAWGDAAAPPPRSRPELADGKCKPRQKLGVRFLPVNEGEVV